MVKSIWSIAAIGCAVWIIKQPEYESTAASCDSSCRYRKAQTGTQSKATLRSLYLLGPTSASISTSGVL